LLEAVFFTARVSAALNRTDNLYEFFSARRRVCLTATLHADFQAFVAMFAARTIDASALARFATKR
jgi:hypothetical protein